MEVVISEPARTYVRIRRMVHPYEVLNTDTYAKNEYPPQAHHGIENVVEAAMSSTSPQSSQSEAHSSTKSAPRQTFDVTNPVDTSISQFYLDGVFQSHLPRKSPAYASQETLWTVLGTQLLQDVMSGFNSSLLCIGSQGSGKTHTLFGPKCINGIQTLPLERNAGLIPRFCQSLFEQIDELDSPIQRKRSRAGSKTSESSFSNETVQHLVEVSCYEIRSEQVYDLLNPSDYDVQVPNTLHEHPKIGPHVQRLVSLTCDTSKKCVEVIEAARAALGTTNLFRGTLDGHDHVVYRFTVTKRVNMNEEASTKEVEKEDEDTFQEDPTNDNGFSVVATFIDCAASCDRSLALLDSRSDRLHEKLRIHQSWETMVRCVDILADHQHTSTIISSHKKREPPYHASSLTHLLHRKAGPLGGDGRSYVLGHVGPTNIDYSKTMETLRCLRTISRVRNRPGVQRDATGRLSRGYRAHLSLVERELAQLQADVPEWANPSTPPEEMNERGIKMTQHERETYLKERKATWNEYRAECQRLAQELIDTQQLLERHEEIWPSRKKRSEDEYVALLRWLKGKSAMHGLRRSAFQENSDSGSGSTNFGEGKGEEEEKFDSSSSTTPRLISLHSNRAYVGVQAIYLDMDGNRVTLGGSKCGGMNVNKSMCQVSRNDSAALEQQQQQQQRREQNVEDPDEEQTPVPTGLTLHVSPRADVFLNGKRIAPNESALLHDNDIIVLGVHRMYRVEAFRGRNASKKLTSVHEETTWFDGVHQLVKGDVERLLKVEQTIVQECRDAYEETNRRLDELQAQLSVEKRSVKQAEGKRRRAVKKKEKENSSLDPSEQTKFRKQIDALQRRVDTLEGTFSQRSSECDALKRRVSEAERGSRILLPMLLKDLMALRHLQMCVNTTLSKSTHTFTPRLVPNHSKVAKMALHSAGDHMMHDGPDVELWMEVARRAAASEPTSSPNRGRSRRNINRNSPRKSISKNGSGKAQDADSGIVTTVMWNRDRFLLRYHLMRKMHDVYRLADGGSNDSRGTSAIMSTYNNDNDPYMLGSKSGHQVIGQSHMYLDSLSYFIEFEEVVAVIDFRGKEVGRLRIQVTPTRLAGVELMLDEIDEQQTKSLRDYIGEEYTFIITIVDCRSLPSDSCSNVYLTMSLPDLEGEEASLSKRQNKQRKENSSPDDDEKPVQNSRFFETPKNAHDTVHPAFDVPIKVTMEITEHMCNALSTDMVEFTILGCKPGSGHSIEEHEDPEFAKKRRRKDPVAHELYETKTQLSRLSVSLSTTKLEMEEAKLEARDKQVSCHYCRLFS